MQQLNALIERIHSRRAVIGIVGLGYVGLPDAELQLRGLSDAGH